MNNSHKAETVGLLTYSDALELDNFFLYPYKVYVVIR